MSFARAPGSIGGVCLLPAAIGSVVALMLAFLVALHHRMDAVLRDLVYAIWHLIGIPWGIGT